jgi:hypothetical protein
MDGKINPGAGGNVSQDCDPDGDEAIASSLDLQVIRVELSERRRERGDSVSVAACSIATVEGTAAPICNLVRKLLALGVDPATHLSIWRGEMCCFHDTLLGRWAELTVEEGSSEPVFRRYKPFPGRAVASLRAKSDG